MADKKQFAFLKDTWGIELSEQAINIITDTSESLDPRSIQAYLKDTDIRKFGITSSLPKELTRLTDALPHGKYMVQVQKIADITQPSKFQEDFEGGKWRLLAVDFTDGEQKFRGIEYRQDTCEVLGGEVEKLVESWRASKDVAEQRLLWRTEGVKKKEKGEGAPAWEDFDPRKAPPRGSAGVKKQQEDEMAMWRCEAAKGGQAKKEIAAERDQKETRFQKSDFQADGEETKQVKSQVTSNAFAQAPAKGCKGKGSKGENEGKSKGGKGRWDRDGDDYQEEKRAPTAAANTLAAFIKPTKKGDASEEAVAALLAPDQPAVRAAGNGGWDAGWNAGWDDAAWHSGGGGGGGWGGGGGSWSSGYKGGGGGKGGRKGGKGGGKGKRH